MWTANNQISGRQITRLLWFDLLGYSALLIPVALAKTSGRDGIFSILLGVAFAFLYLKCLKRVIRFQEKSYGACIKNRFGVGIGALIKAGYVIYFLLLAGRVASILAELVVEELLAKQFRLILFLLMVLVYYGVSGGIESRARVYEILFWILLVPLFIMLLFALPSADTAYWLPVMYENPWAILKGAYQVFLCLSILCLVPFLMEFSRERKQVYGCAKKALAWTGGILGGLYLILLGLFGADALATLDYPVVTMMSRIQMRGGFFKRADALMFGVWFFTLYALINSLVFFAGNLCFEKKKESKVWLLGEVAVVYLLANGFYYSEGFKMLYEKFFAYIGTPFVVVVPLILGLLLSGCASTELEDRTFPTILTISEGTDFTSEWLNATQEGTKKIDYNHLKVILIERSFLENEELMAEMLGLLKEDKNIPLNTYVVTTEHIETLEKGEESLEIPLGDYLEELLENQDIVKRETYPTIGMLYQEKENRKETIFIPTVSLVAEKPTVTSYEAYKRGHAVGQVENDVAMLSFFVGNHLKEYVLQLGVGNAVRLSNTRNEITFEERREVSGRLHKQVEVEIDCDGKILQKAYDGEKEAMEEWLNAQIKEYMEGTARQALERGIDITNSLKHLGEEREWYRYYMQSPDFYEGDIEIVFEIDIDWIN